MNPLEWKCYESYDEIMAAETRLRDGKSTVFHERMTIAWDWVLDRFSVAYTERDAISQRPLYFKRQELPKNWILS